MDDFFEVTRPENGEKILTSRKFFNNQLEERGFVPVDPQIEIVSARTMIGETITASENRNQKGQFRGK